MYEVLKVTTASRFVLTLIIHSENKIFAYKSFKQYSPTSLLNM